MTRRDLLRTSSGALFSTVAAPAPRPNIIFIYGDDLDFDEIDCCDIDRVPCITGAVRTGNFTGGKTHRAYPDRRMLTPNIRL